MANEYRFYQLNAEVINTGEPDAPVAFYQLNAEVISALASGGPINVYQLNAEVITPIEFSPSSLVVSSVSILW